MRILYVHQFFATRQGRAPTRSMEQALEMQRAGHKVTMLTSSAQLRPEEVPAGRGHVRRGQIAGVACLVVDVAYQQEMSYPRRILSFLAFMFWSCWLVMRVPRPDMIFATSTPLTIGGPALIGRWGRRIPYIFEVRDLWPDAPHALGAIRSRLLLATLHGFERCVYRHAAALVAVNEDVAARMRQRTRPGQPIHVVPNACDTNLFRPDRDGSAFRRTHGLEAAVLAVHPGAMGPVNGLDAILDAAASMRDHASLRFAIIGRGNQKPRLAQRVAEEGLDNVLILEALPKEQIADVMATADIGLMTVAPIPLLELNCANKYFDYLASGLPIVLNYQGWQSRILSDHECGLAAAQGDGKTFAENIRTLANDPDRRRRMSERARKLAEGPLNRRQVIQPILDQLAAMEQVPSTPATKAGPAPALDEGESDGNIAKTTSSR